MKKGTVMRRVSKDFDMQIKELAKQMGIPLVTATKHYTEDELLDFRKRKRNKSGDYIIEAIYKKTFTVKKKKGGRTDLFDFKK